MFRARRSSSLMRNVIKFLFGFSILGLPIFAIICFLLKFYYIIVLHKTNSQIYKIRRSFMSRLLRSGRLLWVEPEAIQEFIQYLTFYHYRAAKLMNGTSSLSHYSEFVRAYTIEIITFTIPNELSVWKIFFVSLCRYISPHLYHHSSQILKITTLIIENLSYYLPVRFYLTNNYMSQPLLVNLFLVLFVHICNYLMEVPPMISWCPALLLTC